jgi:hypothetical protein
MNYRHGWINSSTYPGQREHFSANVPGFSVVYSAHSLHAAKLAITRDFREVQARRARDAAEHHRSIQSIVTGG